MSKRRRKPNQVIGWVNIYLDDGRGESHPVLRKGGLRCSNGSFGWWHDGGPITLEISITKKPRWATPYRRVETPYQGEYFDNSVEAIETINLTAIRAIRDAKDEP